ncbi:MAG: putative toxin-antitoxin system toxin component, PIN family [Candidatus Aminicenantes bacterium]|nr:putative toxin-antitoxin system toxin component, PIN family [Candidatus Aminicenantes bacterium]
MKVRAVIDTNVVVSALIRPKGPAAVLWRRLCEGAFTAVFSTELIDEIAAVLGRPKIRTRYGTTPKDLEVIAALFALRGDLVACGERVRICRDPNDDFLLETAVSGKADYLVSGDEDLLTLKKFRQTRIVKPAAFLAAIEKAGR